MAIATAPVDFEAYDRPAKPVPMDGPEGPTFVRLSHASRLDAERLVNIGLISRVNLLPSW